MREEMEKAFRQGFVWIVSRKGDKAAITKYSLSDAILKWDKAKGEFCIRRKTYPMFMYMENYGRKRTEMGHVWALERWELEAEKVKLEEAGMSFDKWAR